MNPVITKRERFAAFIERHKVALAISATAAVTTIVVSRAVNAINQDNFDAAMNVIDAHDLRDEFNSYFEEN